ADRVAFFAFLFFSSRRRHTSFSRDWSSDVCSSDLNPRVVGPAIADALTGFYAAYGVLGALVERARTGLGKRVDVSMLEAMCHFNLDAFTHLFSEGEVMGPYSRPSVSQSYTLRCADGKWIALHMSSPEKFWQALAEAIEQPDIFKDPRFATRE